jgi:hypothetical protein
MVKSCFLTQLTSLRLLIGKLRPLTFIVIIERYIVFLSFVVFVMFVSLLILISSLNHLFIFICYSSFICITYFLGCIHHLCEGFPYISWRVFISLLVMKGSFAGYSNLGWELFLFRACTKSFHTFLAFIVSVEKSSVIVIDLPL